MEVLPKTRRSSWSDRLIPLSIIILATLIAGILFFDLSETTVLTREETPISVTCTEGKTLIVRDKIQSIPAGGSGVLSVWDRVRTLPSSAATIFWPDGSITRLGERSSLLIHEAATNQTWLQIDFSLENGRSWTNVVTPIFSGSYFRERYNDETTIATVRGTVFEIDLDRKYIHTVSHAIEIAGDGYSGSLLSAGSIAHIVDGKQLSEKILDPAWNELNSRADSAYVSERIAKFNTQILTRFGKKNYFTSFLEYIGIRRANPLDRMLDVTNRETIFDPRTMDISQSDLENAKILYSQIGNLEWDEKIDLIKGRLENTLMAHLSEDEKTDFLDHFARRNLYELWRVGTQNSPEENISRLRQKTSEYLQMWANREMLERLERSFQTKSVDRIKWSIRDTKDTLQKKNYLDEIIPPIHPDQIDMVNDRATQIRRGILERLRDVLGF